MPAEQFETSDGHFLIINATTQRVFERLCEAIGQPDLPNSELFTPRKNLHANHEAIHHVLDEWVKLRTLEECMTILNEFGVPASKVYATSDIVEDPHYAARDQVLTVDSADFGPLLQPGIAPRLTDTPGRVYSRAPKLGEHNAEVYGGLLGLDAGELERYAAEGII